MMIYIASDHSGFELKQEISELLKSKKLEVKDLGPRTIKQDDDYPDFAFPLALKVAAKKNNVGILICRSGIGMSIAANKVKGIKAALCTSVSQAVTARAHNNCNILVLAADFVKPEKNLEIINTFLEASFCQEERHIRRLKKIEDYEACRRS